MKHIPIMLALALSINLTSFDENTTTNIDTVNMAQESLVNNSAESEVLNDIIEVKLEDE